ncbi:hypothetical protein GCM10009840_26970 [Pseudolysinimonas kribbensis]|uniref:Uncharacterized protein n=1 Tax=Pseudolysinimonas kribbensis TaxID=433641 RepID=A0ABQ6K9W1_9MICO|nr:hypothetical protein GCM10025881_33200 [Pseudolysinimonas kribbensis]
MSFPRPRGESRAGRSVRRPAGDGIPGSLLRDAGTERVADEVELPSAHDGEAVGGIIAPAHVVVGESAKRFTNARQPLWTERARPVNEIF